MKSWLGFKGVSDFVRAAALDRTGIG